MDRLHGDIGEIVNWGEGPQERMEREALLLDEFSHLVEKVQVG